LLDILIYINDNIMILTMTPTLVVSRKIFLE